MARKLKWDAKEPCGSCPYRKDAKLGLWHPSEFDELAVVEQDAVGSVFACHSKKNHPSVCAGWLLLQKRNDLPSVALRLHLHRNPKAAACLQAVTDGGLELYESVGAMIAANDALGRCGCGRYLGSDGTCSFCAVESA